MKQKQVTDDRISGRSCILQQRSFASRVGRLMLGLPLLLCLIGTGGCSKTERSTDVASLTIVNTLTTPLIVNFNEQDSVIYTNGGVNQFLYGRTSLQYSLPARAQWVNLHELNTSTIIPTWEEEALYRTRVQLLPGEMWSLFLTGTIDQPDTLLVRDYPLSIPVSDSSLGIRFVNLSGPGQEVSVNLLGQAPGSEVAAMPYEAATDFRQYAAHVATPSYFFEFRNSSTGDLLASAVISNPGTVVGSNQWRYRNFTIVFCGMAGSPSAPPSAFIVTNY